MQPPVSQADVLDVVVLRGAEAAPDAPPRLLVEAPHGATLRDHYDRHAAQMRGPLPDGLEIFFHVNTDVGSWEYGLRTAQRLIEADPTLVVWALRSLVPRTLVDCNRVVDAPGGDLTRGGLTAGIPPYVHDPLDRARLLDLHARYVAVVSGAIDAVCGAGGLALIPHTYGPVSLGIPFVDEQIVRHLRDAHEPTVYATWPTRPEIDVLTRDLEGRSWCPEGLEAALMSGFGAAGFQATANHTYQLHPATLGHRWSTRWPGRVLTLEVRRDLLVEVWRPFEPMSVDADAVDRVALVLATALRPYVSAPTP